MAEPEIVADVSKAVKKNPALGIAGVVIIAALLYYLYQRGQAATIAPASSAPAATPGFTPALGTYTYTQDIHQTGPAGPAGPTGQPGPTGPTGPTGQPQPQPQPPPQNPISGVAIPLPAPPKSTVQFGSIGNVGQRVYVTLPSKAQYKVYGDSDSQLPKGTTFKPGGNNSWWYVLPGRQQQYLVLPG
jgi:hypothetical protein